MPKLLRRRKSRRPMPCQVLAQSESLEDKVLLAGGVSAMVRGGDIIIRGDDADNKIEVRANAEGGISVFGLEETTINGTVGPVELMANTTVPDDIRVVLGNGDDLVRIEGIDVGDDVRVVAGSGSDAVGFFDANIGGSVAVIGSRGSDDVSIDATTIGDKLKVSLSKGQDTLGIDASTVSGRARIVGGSGEDRVAVRQSTMGDNVVVVSGSGSDAIGLKDAQIDGRAVVRTGSGDDTLAAIDSVFAADVRGNGGSNDDTLGSFGATFESDFDFDRFEEELTEADAEAEAQADAEIEAAFLDLVESEARLGTVAELLLVNSDLSDLADAAEAAGITAALASDTVTVFAPTNDAFAAVDADVMAALMADPTGLLKDVLDYHTVARSLDAEALADVSSVTTVFGSDIALDSTSGLTLNGTSTAVQTDIRAKNGFVHLIDEVLSLPVE